MPDNSSTIWAQLWANAPQISGIVAALAVLWALIGWSLGSVKPQSQIDIEALKAAVTAHQAQLGALPRDKDFQDWTVHLSRLDARADTARDDQVQMKYDIKDLQNKLQSLTIAPKGNRQ